MKRLGLVILLLFTFLGVKAQLRMAMTPQVVGSNLEIVFEISNVSGVDVSIGAFDMPFTLDTVGLDIAGLTIVESEFGASVSSFYDLQQAVVINANTINYAIRPDYVSNNPADDSNADQILEANSSATVGTLVIPVNDCKTDLMLDWVPDSDVLGGARLDWLGNNLDPVPRNTIASPFAVVAATLEVTNTDDAGCGSLRNAIETANTTPGADTIVFNIPSGSQITLNSPLIVTDDSTVVEFPTPNCLGEITIIGDGSFDGFQLNDVEATVIRGFNIQRFENGILINLGNNNIVQCNYIGTNAVGAAPSSNVYGIHIVNSTRNLIGDTTANGRGNLISGNIRDGIFIEMDSPFNVISSNRIGTNAAGTAALSNDGNGIFISGGGNNTIGGANALTPNVISGNEENGIEINASNGNVILSSFIGTNQTGTGVIGNLAHGVLITNGSSGNSIGERSSRTGNLISGNEANGVAIISSNINRLQHNFIGTDINGTISLSNQGDGVLVSNSSSGNFIGDTTDTRGNIISGNAGNGVTVSQSQNNLVGGNVIGLGFDGITNIPNTKGVFITGNLSDANIIGNTLSTGGGNFISSNNAEGIHIETANNTQIFRNFIGLDTNAAAAGNGASNILLSNGASGSSVALNGIAYAPTGAYGIEVNGGATTTDNLWVLNAIYSNGDEGISFGTGNEQDGINPPTISVNGLTFSGTARNGVQVQLFSDSVNQGQVYLDTAMASPTTGAWSKTFTLADLQSYVAAGRSFITAIQTDRSDLTEIVSSEFSDAVEICIPPVADIQNPSSTNWEFCRDDSLSITSTFVAGATYNFYLESTNTTIINIQDSTATLVKADFSAGNTDNLIVEVQSAQPGCVGRDTVEIVLLDSVGSEAGTALPVCSNASVSLNGTVSAGATGTWYSLGSGVFSPDPNTLNANYTPGADDISNGQLTLYLEADNGVCSPKVDTLKVSVSPAPTIDIGADQTICIGDDLEINASLTIANDVFWQIANASGTGSFTTNPGTSTIYQPSNADEVSGTAIEIVGQSLNQGLCNSEYDTLLLTIVSSQQVDAGPDTIACPPINVDLLATSFPGYIYTWTRAGGGVATAPTANDSVFTATQEGKYYVDTESSTGGCASRDSVIVTAAPTLVDPNVVFFNANSTSVTFAWDSVVGAVDYTLSIDTCRYPDLSGCTSLPTVTFPNNGPFRYTQGNLSVGDSVNFTVVANGGCGGTTNPVTAFGSADSCNAHFSGLASSYCTASFLARLYPEFEGGTFTSSPVSTAIQHSGTFYYFDPAEAGPGTHWVYYENCNGSMDSAMAIVAGAPCVTTAVDDSTSAFIKDPFGIATDCEGQIYTSSNSLNALVKVDTFGTASIISGDTVVPGFLDGSLGTSLIERPYGLVAHPSGEIYFIDGQNHALRKVTTSNETITIIGGGPSAGTGAAGQAGDSDSPSDAANNRMFSQPFGLAFNSTFDTVFIADAGNGKIKAVDLSTLTVTTIAGNPAGAVPAVAGPQPATNARFVGLGHLSADNQYLYISDIPANAVYAYDFTDQRVYPFVGNGGAGGTLGDTSVAQLNQPNGVTVDPAGNLFIADKGNNSIKQANRYTNPGSVTVGNMVGSNDQFQGNVCLDGDASTARMTGPTAVSVFVKGFIDIADAGCDKIRRYAIEDYLNNPLRNLDTIYCESTEPDTLELTTFAGGYSGTDISSAGGYWLFTPETPGTHTICYDYSSGYCNESICMEVTVVPNPVVDLGADTTIICSNQFNIDSLKVDSNLVTIDWRVNGTLDPGDEWFRVIDQAPARYTVAVEDTNGCTANDTVDIILSRSVVDAGATPLTICAFSNDTIADATINGAVNTPAGYTVSWSPAVGLNRTDTLHPVVNYNDTTLITYYLSVTDTVGCIDTDSIKYTIEPTPTVSAVTVSPSDTILCLGSTVAITANPSVVWSNLTPFSWTPSASLDNATWRTPNATPTDTTVYRVVFTDDNGCTAEDSVTLYPQNPYVEISLSQDTACVGDLVTATATVYGSPDNRLSYNWEGQGYTDQNTFTFTLSSAVDSVISISVVDTTSGCAPFEDADTLIANDLRINFAQDIFTICNVDSANIDATISGGTMPYTILWTGSIGDVIETPTDEDPTLQPAATGGSYFYVDVTSAGAAACSITDSVFVDRLLPLDVQAVAVTPGDTILCLGNTVAITANPSVVWSNLTPFSWAPSASLDNATWRTPNATPTDTTVYTVTFTDDNNCTAEDSITLYPVNPRVEVVLSQDTACVGDLVTATATVYGSPDNRLSYNWEGQGYTDQNTFTFTLSSQRDSVISVMVVDTTSGCGPFTEDDTLVVNDLSISFDQEIIDICNNDSAQIESTISGGIPPYTVTWTGSAGDVIELPSDEDPKVQPVVLGGSYFYVEVTGSGSAGCTIIDSVFVNRKDPITIQASTIAVEDTIFCLGDNVDLTARAIPASAGGVYSWRASDGTVIPAIQSPTITPLDTITVYATYIDADNCESSEDSVVLYPQVVSPTITFSKDTACFEENITITAGQSGGVGPFVYSWNNGTTYSVTNFIDVTPRADTTIIVYVYDSASTCEEFMDTTLVISDLSVVFASDSVGVCFDSLATLEAIVSGGKPGYNVTWTGPGTIASPGSLITDVTTGTAGTSEIYTVSITDQPIGASPVGCTVTEEIVVYMNTEIIVEAGADTTICAGNPVTRMASAIGGQAPYTFGWTDGGAFNQAGGTLNVSPTDSTLYYLGARDVYNCPGIDSVAINTINPQIDVVTQFNNFCPGTRDSVYVDLTTPGSGNYEYSFDGGLTFGPNAFVILFPTMDTTVNAILRDLTGGCELSGSVDIDVQDFSIDLGPDKALCTGLIDPSTNTIGYKINSTLVGGSTPFSSIVWDVTAASPPSSSAADVDITQTDILNPTIRPNTSSYTDAWFEYFITIVDDAGCTVSDTVRIYYPEPFITFVAPLGAVPVLCDGQNQQLGYPAIPTEGGVQPYNVVWDAPGTNVDGSTEDAPIFQSNGSGTFIFTKNVTDSIGCVPQYVGGGGASGSPQAIQVQVNDAPAIDFEVDGVAVSGSDTATYCEGTGFTMENVATHTGTVTHDWRYPNNTGTSISNTTIATDSREGWFFLRVDDVSCFRNDSVFMLEIPLATVSIDAVAGPVCDNEDIVLTATYSPSGGSFAWTSSGAGTITTLNPEEDSVAYTIDPADGSPLTFDVTYNAGCNDANATPTPVAVTVSPTAALEFSSTSLLPTDTIMVMDTSIYPTGWSSSVFYFQNGIQNGVPNENAVGTAPYDVFEVRWDDPGTHNVCVKVTETTGCSDSLCVRVNVVGSELYYIPNVMSPKANNAENQVVKVYGPSLVSDNFKFEVYNRWGELIFETDDFVLMNTVGWNGENQNTGVIEANGVYTYRADLSFEGGAKTQVTGTITIVK